MTRPEWVEAGARAWDSPFMERDTVAAVIAAVEPLIRADALTEFQGATEMDRRAWRDDFVEQRIRAQISGWITDEAQGRAWDGFTVAEIVDAIDSGVA